MFNKNRDRKKGTGQGSSSQFRRGNAAISRTQQAERLQRQQATERQLSLSKKIQSHKRRLRGLVALSVILIALFMWRSTVSSVNVTSSQNLTEAQQMTYSNYILGRVGEFSVFKQGWSTDGDALSRDIMKKFPEVNDVEVSGKIPLLSSLKVSLSFRQPEFVWRDSGGEKRYIDNQGVLFENNNTSIDIKKLIVINDQSGLVLDSGSSAVSEATAEVIGKMPLQLKSMYPKGIESVVIPKSTREVRVKPAGAGYYIKFSTERSLEAQTGELRTLKRYLDKKNVKPADYIDIRLEHKAFYK